MLGDGLAGRWCDRYPNQGKRSGAFSCGSYDGWPYILMNYQPDVLDHVFTLAHEAGHSMHSHYSAKHQPYRVLQLHDLRRRGGQHVQRAAPQPPPDGAGQDATRSGRTSSTARSTPSAARSSARRCSPSSRRSSHALVEAGEPLTVECLKTEYGKLLADYFGPDFVIDEELKLECLRIPHFYSAFYVYKYATGLSAAIALSERVVSGGKTELNDYLSFLKGGCSKWPLDLLKDAGVDMTKPGAGRDGARRISSGWWMSWMSCCKGPLVQRRKPCWTIGAASCVPAYDKG